MASNFGSISHTEYETKLQIRNSSVVRWKQKVWTELDRYLASDAFKNKLDAIDLNEVARNLPAEENKTEEKKPYSGDVTIGSKKRIKKAIDILLQVVPERIIFNPVLKIHHPFKVGFVTLTIPDNLVFVSGANAHKMLLRPFLDWLTKTKGCNTYIWKAERQGMLNFQGDMKGSQGQLHYHVTIPIFIHYIEIRDKWNSLLLKHNLQGYDGTGKKFFNPNSTDVHSVKNVQDLEAYLIKYIAKKKQSHIKIGGKYVELPKALNGKTYIPDELPKGAEVVYCIEYMGKLIEINQSVEGKVWDCSHNLKTKKYYSITMQKENFDRVNDLTDLFSIKTIEKDNCTIYITDNDTMKKQFLTIEQATRYEFWKRDILKSIVLQDEKI